MSGAVEAAARAGSGGAAAGSLGPVVVKIGSSTLTTTESSIDYGYLASLADQVAAIKAQGYQPIIVTSARTAAADKVGLLGQGADDYLTKPFDLDELAARVAVQLRHRAQGHQGVAGARGASSVPGAASTVSGASAPLRCGRWMVDQAARTLSVDGGAVPLTRTEYAIAELLASHPGRVFTKQELFEHAWGEPYAAQESTVSAHVSNLRAKLKPTGTDGYVATVWGIGFKLDVG